MKTYNYILSLQKQLDAAASPKTKTWWERYLRGVAAFRGVGIPQIRDILRSWRQDTGVAGLPEDEQLEIALACFDVPTTEDKLAGVLLLQDYLRTRFDWRVLLPRYAQLYERNLIYDWNTCDWILCEGFGADAGRERYALCTGIVHMAEFRESMAGEIRCRAVHQSGGQLLLLPHHKGGVRKSDSPSRTLCQDGRGLAPP